MDESFSQFFGTTSKHVDLHIILSIIELIRLFAETIERFLAICILGFDDSKTPACLDVEDLETILLVEPFKGDWLSILLWAVKTLPFTAIDLTFEIIFYLVLVTPNPKLTMVTNAHEPISSAANVCEVTTSR